MTFGNKLLNLLKPKVKSSQEPTLQPDKRQQLWADLNSKKLDSIEPPSAPNPPQSPPKTPHPLAGMRVKVEQWDYKLHRFLIEEGVILDINGYNWDIEFKSGKRVCNTCLSSVCKIDLITTTSEIA